MTKLIGIAAAAALTTIITTPVMAQSAPDAPGKDKFIAACSGCHSIDQIVSQRKSREGWTQLVETMRGFGAPGSNEDFEFVIDYLSKNLGVTPYSAAPVAPEAPLPPAAAASTPAVNPAVSTEPANTASVPHPMANSAMTGATTPAVNAPPVAKRVKPKATKDKQ